MRRARSALGLVACWLPGCSALFDARSEAADYVDLALVPRRSALALGENTVLHIRAGGADRAEIHAHDGAVLARLEAPGDDPLALLVRPLATTTYVLTATRGARLLRVESTVEVRGEPRPEIEELSVSPDRAQAGQSADVLIRWAVREGSRAELAIGQAVEPLSPRGQQGRVLMPPSRITLKAVNGRGNVEAHARLRTAADVPADANAPGRAAPLAGMIYLVPGAAAGEHWFSLDLTRESLAVVVERASAGGCARGVSLEVTAGGARNSVGSPDSCARVDPRVHAFARDLQGQALLRMSIGRGDPPGFVVYGEAIPPEPGNGVLEGREDCDDGDRVQGDGCDDGGRLESGLRFTPRIEIGEVEPLAGARALELDPYPANPESPARRAVLPLARSVQLLGQSHDALVVHDRGFVTLAPETAEREPAAPAAFPDAAAPFAAAAAAIQQRPGLDSATVQTAEDSEGITIEWTSRLAAGDVRTRLRLTAAGRVELQVLDPFPGPVISGLQEERGRVGLALDPCGGSCAEIAAQRRLVLEPL